MNTPLAIAPNGANVLLGRGKIYGDRLSLVNGIYVRTGEFDLGNCTAFEITPKATVKEKFESMDPASSLYARGVTQQTHSIKITGDEYSLYNLANALMGGQGQISAAGGTVSGSPGETVNTAPQAYAWYSLQYRNVSAVSAKIGAVALVAGQDYNLDATRGRLQILPSSVASIQLTSGGTGYTTAPTVTFSAPPAGGTQATGTATVTGGVVTGITITNAGSGYTSAPTISFAGAGTGAAATATMGALSGTLTAGYTYASYIYNTVQAGTLASVDMYIRYVGNPVKGPTFEGEFWHVQFTPNGSLGFIKDDFGDWTIEGMCIADFIGHPSEPLYHLIQLA